MKRIIVENISKKFKIGFKKKQTALARFISIFSGREPKKIFWALKNISFSTKEGEIIGIIGENGSGKSTLLRVIAGIYDKDNGIIKINGKIISLINLYIGKKERLTMRDNINLCGSFFNLNKKIIKKRFNSIVEFAELEDFVNTKVYQFSEGMRQRLAFSIAIHCDPDILLLDEVLEVGDEEFRNKSINRIKELAQNGMTVLLVSSNLDLIKKSCNRVIWLHEGRIKSTEDPKKVIAEYIN